MTSERKVICGWALRCYLILVSSPQYRSPQQFQSHTMSLPATETPPLKETYHQIVPHFILRQFHFIPPTRSKLYVLSHDQTEIGFDEIGLDAGNRRFEIVGEPGTYPAKYFYCMILLPAAFNNVLYRGFMANWMSLKTSRIRRTLNTYNPSSKTSKTKLPPSFEPYITARKAGK